MPRVKDGTLVRNCLGKDIKNAATLRGLSSLNKNLERILAMNSNKCPILLDLYEECMSRTPTDYGAKRCDNYREMMASCGEIKMVWSSKPSNPLVTLDGALYFDSTFHGKDMQPKKDKAIVPTSSHKKRALIKPIVDVEWEESQQREAIAKGFANRKDYWRHQSETNPKMCRITYELYEECYASGKKIRKGFRKMEEEEEEELEGPSKWVEAEAGLGRGGGGPG
ncbi:hypothetical protein LOK49_LG01G00137 [Camellia lanceoleosa]|uniref:Uncharacterized protein n=1 Tax=Camellia lanceoleosa TaxID=1840588 RepID=A0ACC0J3A1_9ERIC|nr:hypothetical protein LOK49_LG01G00137 [Camellia lanceoleosa]